MGSDADFAPEPPIGPGQSAGSAYRAAVEAFGEVASALNEMRDRDALLRLIGRHICRLVGIARCSVYLRDPESGLYRGEVRWSQDWEQGAERDVGARIKRLVAGTEADAFTREIVETRRPVVVADARWDRRPIQSAMRSWGVRSMLGVPMVLRGEVTGIVFLDNADEPHVFTETESEIAAAFANLAAIAISRAEMTTSLRRTLHTSATQNDLLRRAAEMDERLTLLVVAGGGLARIAEAVAELTRKPCEIYDAAGARLAVAPPDGATPARLDEHVHKHPAFRRAVERLGGMRGGVIGPLPEAGVPYRCLYSPIATRDDVCGWLVVVEHGSRFGPLDRHIARRGAANAALELAAERRAAHSELDARGSLARSLIRGAGDLAPIRRRAEYLGVDLRRPQVVCVVASQGDSPVPPAPVLAEAFAARGSSVLATPVAEGVAVIVPLRDRRAPPAAVAAARAQVECVLEGLGDEATLVAALGAPCASVHDYVRGYVEASEVMACVRAFAEPGRRLVLSADELGAGRVFLASSSRAEAERFATDALEPLLRVSEDGKGELLRTLEVFFRCDRTVRKAASELGVHENTIRYRLARIEKLTGLAVGDDGTHDMTASLALLVLRLLRLARGKDDPPPG